MYDIKELTKDIYQNAERQEFIKTLMSGKIKPKLYAIYLYNQLLCYAEVEKYGLENSLFITTIRSWCIFHHQLTFSHIS